MSKSRKPRRGGGKRERHIVVRGVRRDPPDLRKLSRAVIALAQAQAEKEAQEQQQKHEAPGEAASGEDNDAR